MHIGDLHRAPAEAVDELRALDDRIAARIGLLAQRERGREHRRDDAQPARSGVDLDVIDGLAIAARARRADRHAGEEDVDESAGPLLDAHRLHVLRRHRRRHAVSAASATTASAARKRCAERRRRADRKRAHRRRDHRISSDATPAGMPSGRYAFPTNARMCPLDWTTNPGSTMLTGPRALRCWSAATYVSKYGPSTCLRSGSVGPLHDDGEHLARRRNEFAHDRSRRRRDLVHRVALHARDFHLAFEHRVIGGDRRFVTAERCGGGKREGGGSDGHSGQGDHERCVAIRSGHRRIERWREGEKCCGNRCPKQTRIRQPLPPPVPWARAGSATS